MYYLRCNCRRYVAIFFFIIHIFQPWIFFFFLQLSFTDDISAPTSVSHQADLPQCSQSRKSRRKRQHNKSANASNTTQHSPFNVCPTCFLLLFSPPFVLTRSKMEKPKKKKKREESRVQREGQSVLVLLGWKSIKSSQFDWPQTDRFEGDPPRLDCSE